MATTNPIQDNNIDIVFKILLNFIFFLSNISLLERIPMKGIQMQTKIEIQ